MALPVTPSDDTRRRLLLAKALYDTALTEASAPLRSHRRIIAVVSLDLANETLLKAVCWDLGRGEQPERKYQALLDSARTMVAKESTTSTLPTPPLPGEAGALDVHTVRNDAQHRGRAPAEDVLAACRTHTRDFQVGLARLVWGADYDALAASEAIEEPSVRTEMAEAEAALQKGDYLAAVRAARHALTNTSVMATYEHRFSPFDRYRYSPAVGHNPLAELTRDLDREFTDVRSFVRRVALGLDRRVSGARTSARATRSAGGRVQARLQPARAVDRGRLTSNGAGRYGSGGTVHSATGGALDMRRAVVAVMTTLLLLLASMGSAAALTPSGKANCVAVLFIAEVPVSEPAQEGGIGGEVGAGEAGRGTGLAPTNCGGD